MAERGSIIVLTGDGKGETTSALGMAMRAVGHGLRVAFLQFIKQRGLALRRERGLHQSLNFRPWGGDLCTWTRKTRTPRT